MQNMSALQTLCSDFSMLCMCRGGNLCRCRNLHGQWSHCRWVQAGKKQPTRNSVPGLHLYKNQPTLEQPRVLLEGSVLTRMVNVYSLGNAVLLPRKVSEVAGHWHQRVAEQYRTALQDHAKHCRIGRGFGRLLHPIAMLFKHRQQQELSPMGLQPHVSPSCSTDTAVLDTHD